MFQGNSASTFGLFTAVLLLIAPRALIAQDINDISHRAVAGHSLPLSNTSSGYVHQPQMMSIVQERAKFEADQRQLRMEWNKWIGYSPLRPTMNGSYMSNGLQVYYLPSRGYIASARGSSPWYW